LKSLFHAGLNAIGLVRRRIVGSDRVELAKTNIFR